ncbi:hypothetical protein UK82_15195 [Frankia sp. ACN1ag]|nr:hypothetical protein UK82_15195 [Frankia sp. ACN1ag]
MTPALYTTPDHATSPSAEDRCPTNWSSEARPLPHAAASATGISSVTCTFGKLERGMSAATSTAAGSSTIRERSAALAPHPPSSGQGPSRRVVGPTSALQRLPAPSADVRGSPLHPLLPGQPPPLSTAAVRSPPPA